MPFGKPSEGIIVSKESIIQTIQYPFKINSNLTRDLFLEGLQSLENYMVRRYIAGESTNYLNKVFPSLWKEIDLKQFIPSLKNALVAKNYPGDHRLRQELLVEGMYDRSIQTRSKTTLVLETINAYLSDKKNTGAYTILSGEPTIEHIMPQTIDKTWETELGVNYEQVYRDYLHTLGNLTLVTSEWNSKLSNSPFSLKKTKLAYHGLLLNSDYFGKPIYQWNEQAIRDRAAFLGDLILEIWPAIGEPPAPKTSAGLKPIAVVILGDRIAVSTWRDVACQSTEMIIKVVGNFDDIAETMPAYLEREKFPIACRQLSNGWYMNTNLSAAAIKTYCRNLIAAAGLAEDDWRLEEE